MSHVSRENALAPALRPELGANGQIIAPAVRLEPSQPLFPEPELPAFRFSLRHLFWCVTAACLVLAAVVSGAGWAPLATLLFVSVVALHVAGTAIGIRLRQHADERHAWEAGHVVVNPCPPLPTTQPSSFHRRGGLPMPWVPAWIAAGLTVGAIAGAGLLLATIGHRTTPMGVAVGAISTAIVGGWIAFVAASFWAVLRQIWQEAVDEHRQSASR